MERIDEAQQKKLERFYDAQVKAYPDSQNMVRKLIKFGAAICGMAGMIAWDQIFIGDSRAAIILWAYATMAYFFLLVGFFNLPSQAAKYGAGLRYGWEHMDKLPVSKAQIAYFNLKRVSGPCAKITIAGLIVQTVLDILVHHQAPAFVGIAGGIIWGFLVPVCCYGRKIGFKK